MVVAVHHQPRCLGTEPRVQEQGSRFRLAAGLQHLLDVLECKGAEPQGLVPTTVQQRRRLLHATRGAQVAEIGAALGDER